MAPSGAEDRPGRSTEKRSVMLRLEREAQTSPAGQITPVHRARSTHLGIMSELRISMSRLGGRTPGLAGRSLPASFLRGTERRELPFSVRFLSCQYWLGGREEGKTRAGLSWARAWNGA